MGRLSVVFLGLVLSSSSVACAPAVGGGRGAASVPAVQFPTRAEVAQIPAQPARPEAFPQADVLADAWTFETPPPAEDAAYDDASPWGDFARAQVAAHASTASLSPALRCAALEIARFHRGHKGLPAESLRRFIVARCGGISPAVTPSIWWVEAPAKVTDAALVEKARQALAPHFDEMLGSGGGAGPPMLVGLGVVRDARGASVVTLFARDEARVDAGSRRADAQHRVVVRGQARGDYAELFGFVNRGRYGADLCVSDPTVKAPHFSFTCSLAADDPFAWVEVVGRRKGLVLQHAVATVLAEAADESSIQYARRPSGPAALVKDADALRASLVAGVNRVRAAGHMAPLALSLEQSAENARLVGTLLDQRVGRGDPSADRAALALLAGWNVKGAPIRYGSFYLEAVGPTRDATTWVDDALELPLGRRTLLDPSARFIAVGPSLPDGVDALGAAVTTYAVFDGPDHAADEVRFVQRVEQARVARGLPAPTRVVDFDELTHAAARVHDADQPVTDALHDALEAAASRAHRDVRGYVYETNDLDHVEVPEELLGPGALDMIVTITHHRAPGAAWGQYVVFVILLEEPGSPRLHQARASSTTSG